MTTVNPATGRSQGRRHGNSQFRPHTPQRPHQIIARATYEQIPHGRSQKDNRRFDLAVLQAVALYVREGNHVYLSYTTVLDDLGQKLGHRPCEKTLWRSFRRLASNGILVPTGKQPRAKQGKQCWKPRLRILQPECLLPRMCPTENVNLSDKGSKASSIDPPKPYAPPALGLGFKAEATASEEIELQSSSALGPRSDDDHCLSPNPNGNGNPTPPGEEKRKPTQVDKKARAQAILQREDQAPQGVDVAAQYFDVAVELVDQRARQVPATPQYYVTSVRNFSPDDVAKVMALMREKYPPAPIVPSEKEVEDARRAEAEWRAECERRAEAEQRDEAERRAERERRRSESIRCFFNNAIESFSKAAAAAHDPGLAQLFQQTNAQLMELSAGGLDLVEQRQIQDLDDGFRTQLCKFASPEVLKKAQIYRLPRKLSPETVRCLAQQERNYLCRELLEQYRLPHLLSGFIDAEGCR